MERPAYLQESNWVNHDACMFVQPQWGEIAKLVKQEEGVTEADAWWHVVDHWVNAHVETLNALLAVSGTRKVPYRAQWSEHFVVICPYSEDIAAELPPVAEALRTLALQTLGPLASDPPHPVPIMIMHSPDVAQEYLGPYGVNAFAIAGVCLSGAFTQVVMHSVDRFSLRLTMLHELNHVYLVGRKLPVWLNEGLSRYFESKLLSAANMRFAADVDLRRNRLWRETGLGEFWSGEVFYDGRTGAGYVLACRMVQRLMGGNLPRFHRFLEKASPEDAGRAACVEVYGEDLDRMAMELVGTGAARTR